MIVKNSVKNSFNLSIGKIIRLFQSSLVNRYINIDSVQDLINQNAIQSSASYAIRNFDEAMQFANRQDLWNYCINRSIQSHTSSENIIAEFGVWQGESINFFARNSPHSRLFGFDSFEGLEEDWYGYRLQRGFFSTNGVIPKVEHNVQIIKGWFEDTVPLFIKELGQKQIKILHMDADTYKPTKYVLDTLIGNLTRGSIIIFDEYFGYSNWELHEFKAFQEVVKFSGTKYRYIGHTNMQVAVEIL